MSEMLRKTYGAEEFIELCCFHSVLFILHVSLFFNLFRQIKQQAFLLTRFSFVGISFVNQFIKLVSSAKVLVQMHFSLVLHRLELFLNQ